MAADYVNLYVEINLFSLILVLIVLRRTHGVSRMVEQKTFVMGIISEIVFFMADTLGILVGSKTIHGTNFALLICKSIYFFSTAMMCFVWFLYFEYLRETVFIKQKRKVRLSSLGIWLMGILLIGNFYGKYLFYVRPDGIYERGPLFVLTYILPYSYAAIVWAKIIADYLRKDNMLNRKSQILLVLFPIAPGLSGIVQFYYPQVPVACVAMSLATLVLYLNWTDQLISLDPLTRLNNRKQLELSFKQWTRGLGDSEKLGILLVDADNFKHINDTYGHAQGDAALITIADALNSVCRNNAGKSVIVRYGGDEFVVLVISGDENTSFELKQGISERLKQLIADKGIPYDLSVSIGIASYKEGETLKDLLERADEAMYNEKKLSK